MDMETRIAAERERSFMQATSCCRFVLRLGEGDTRGYTTLFPSPPFGKVRRECVYGTDTPPTALASLSIWSCRYAFSAFFCCTSSRTTSRIDTTPINSPLFEAVDVNDEGQDVSTTVGVTMFGCTTGRCRKSFSIIIWVTCTDAWVQKKYMYTWNSKE